MKKHFQVKQSEKNPKKFSRVYIGGVYFYIKYIYQCKFYTNFTYINICNKNKCKKCKKNRKSFLYMCVRMRKVF